MTFHQRVLSIPQGYSVVQYRDKRYGLSRTDFSGGRSLKIYAEELGGADFISFNYYLTSKEPQFRPCEMPEQKVWDFVMNMTFVEE